MRWTDKRQAMVCFWYRRRGCKKRGTIAYRQTRSEKGEGHHEKLRIEDRPRYHRFYSSILNDGTADNQVLCERYRAVRKKWVEITEITKTKLLCTDAIFDDKTKTLLFICDSALKYNR